MYKLKSPEGRPNRDLRWQACKCSRSCPNDQQMLLFSPSREYVGLDFGLMLLIQLASYRGGHL